MYHLAAVHCQPTLRVVGALGDCVNWSCLLCVDRSLECSGSEGHMPMYVVVLVDA